LIAVFDSRAASVAFIKVNNFCLIFALRPGVKRTDLLRLPESIMIRYGFRTILPLIVALSLPACGLYTPEKSLLLDDTPIQSGRTESPQGSYEDGIVTHVQCETGVALYEAQQKWGLPWLDYWGTSVTLTITGQEQGGASPGVSIFSPLSNNLISLPMSQGGNVVTPRSYSTTLGISGAATATRTETIQFTWLNHDLMYVGKLASRDGCASQQKGVQMDGDLKIAEFIFDNADIAGIGNAGRTLVPDMLQAKITVDPTPICFKEQKRPAAVTQWPLYNTFTGELTFLAAFGGNFTPTWKLARMTANATSTLLSAERTYTNDLVITVGPVAQCGNETTATALSSGAQAQHNSKVNATAIATSIAGTPGSSH
jgi:hypothetical protein